MPSMAGTGNYGNITMLNGDGKSDYGGYCSGDNCICAPDNNVVNHYNHCRVVTRGVRYISRKLSKANISAFLKLSANLSISKK